MAVPKLIHESKGLWHGASQLNLPWLPKEKQVTTSDSRFHIDTDARESHATITYDWVYEGKKQEGTMVIAKAGKKSTVEIGWSDSWHMADGVLLLKGEVAEDGSFKTKGSYSVGTSEPWGWTIGFRLEGNDLHLEMENVHPSGQVDWAVRATYKRD